MDKHVYNKSIYSRYLPCKSIYDDDLNQSYTKLLFILDSE